MGAVIGYPGEDEQQVGEAIQVDAQFRVERFLTGQGDRFPLGPPANGPRQMNRRRRLRPAGQDEVRERRQFPLQRVDVALQLGDLRLPHAGNGLRTDGGFLHRRCQIAPHYEQISLNCLQQLADAGVARLGDSQTEEGVQFVHGSVRGHARVVLGDALSPE